MTNAELTSAIGFFVMTVVAMTINQMWYWHCGRLNDSWAKHCEKLIDSQYERQCNLIDAAYRNRIPQ